MTSQPAPAAHGNVRQHGAVPAHGHTDRSGLEDKLQEFDQRYDETKNFLTKLSIE